MVRPRNINNPRTVTLIVDGDVYDKFIEQLPRKKGTSEAIRELITAQVEETEKIKNLNSLDQSAIKSINIKLSEDFKISEQNKQPKIDFFCIERNDVPRLVQSVDEKYTLGLMEGQCKEFIKHAKMRMQRL